MVHLDCVEPRHITSEGVQALVQHNRAQALLRQWDAFMGLRDYSEARRLVLEWSEDDVELFLGALEKRLEAV